MLLVVRGSGIPATDAANTIVLINSIPVPILAMDNAQIQVQAPFTLATPAAAEIVIVDNGSIAATITVPTAAAAPALFAVDPQASAAGPGVILTFYGTGLGLGDLPVTATIGGKAAAVVSLDPSPGYPGLFQVKIRVPAAAAAGKASVVVMVGGASSQAGQHRDSARAVMRAGKAVVLNVLHFFFRSREIGHALFQICDQLAYCGRYPPLVINKIRMIIGRADAAAGKDLRACLFGKYAEGIFPSRDDEAGLCARTASANHSTEDS
jgi:hypothetical protein